MNAELRDQVTRRLAHAKRDPFGHGHQFEQYGARVIDRLRQLGIDIDEPLVAETVFAFGLVLLESHAAIVAEAGLISLGSLLATGKAADGFAMGATFVAATRLEARA